MRPALTGLAASLTAACAVFALQAAPPKRAAPARPAAPAARDWTRSVVATPEGGIRVGNPAARVKLIEYGSFTCPHCARFAAEGAPALLAKYVSKGRVSFEYRSFVRDPLDMAAALLARCAPPARSRALGDRYFATQQQWIGRFQALDEARLRAVSALPETQRFAGLAQAGGLDAIAVKAGVPAARARQCLTDPAALKTLTAMRSVATDRYQLTATPTFIVNGKNANVYDWATLEPLLARPGG